MENGSQEFFFDVQYGQINTYSSHEYKPCALAMFGEKTTHKRPMN
jgi:hypothetical protein